MKMVTNVVSYHSQDAFKKNTLKGIYLETLFEVHVSILDPSGLLFLDGKKQRKRFPTGLQS